MTFWVIKNGLANDYAGFNRFTESHFIGQQIALRWIAEYSLDYTDLVRVEFDGRRKQCRNSTGDSSLQDIAITKVASCLSVSRSLCDPMREKFNRVTYGLLPTHIDIVIAGVNVLPPL